MPIDSSLNKGTAFTRDERLRLGLEGLLPPRVETLEEQAARALAAVRSKAAALEKYLYLESLRDENETLYFRVLLDHLEELLEQAYAWTGGRALFAAGSPFAPVTLEGRVHVPGQANNSYIFPGVGLGLLTSRARRVTDEMFFAAARALAGRVTAGELERGRLFPAAARMREVAAAVASEVARVAYEQGYAAAARPADLAAATLGAMYEPRYR